MYFLSELKHNYLVHKLFATASMMTLMIDITFSLDNYLVHKLFATARETGVSAELRGWSWHQPPLRPYYEDAKLPMYAVCSKYCRLVGMCI